jgi:hypothetical protein
VLTQLLKNAQHYLTAKYFFWYNKSDKYSRSTEGSHMKKEFAILACWLWSANAFAWSESSLPIGIDNAVLVRVTGVVCSDRAAALTFVTKPDTVPPQCTVVIGALVAQGETVGQVTNISIAPRWNKAYAVLGVPIPEQHAYR